MPFTPELVQTASEIIDFALSREIVHPVISAKLKTQHWGQSDKFRAGDTEAIIYGARRGDFRHLDIEAPGEMRRELGVFAYSGTDLAHNRPQDTKVYLLPFDALHQHVLFDAEDVTRYSDRSLVQATLRYVPVALDLYLPRHRISIAVLRGPFIAQIVADSVMITRRTLGESSYLFDIWENIAKEEFTHPEVRDAIQKALSKDSDKAKHYWSGRRGARPRPSRWQRDVLLAELLPLGVPQPRIELR